MQLKINTLWNHSIWLFHKQQYTTKQKITQFGCKKLNFQLRTPNTNVNDSILLQIFTNNNYHTTITQFVGAAQRLHIIGGRKMFCQWFSSNVDFFAELINKTVFTEASIIYTMIFLWNSCILCQQLSCLLRSIFFHNTLTNNFPIN